MNRSQPPPLHSARRRVAKSLALGGIVGVGGMWAGSRARAAASPQSLAAPEPIARLHAGADLLAVAATGVLWRHAGSGWTRLGDGLDPQAPIAQGHGRIVGRARTGGLWVLEGGRASVTTKSTLAPFGGFAVLPFGVIAVAAVDAARGALVRLEPGNSGWVQTARCAEPVLPDARPLQVDLDGPLSAAGNGHIVVLAGPDGTRYTHGVLGDGIEATRVLYLERHDLSPLRTLTLAAPHVLEDIAPRPIEIDRRTALLTMRSGPAGAQLAIVAADRTRRDALEFAALGEPLGTRNRWMAASTDGRRIAAVHTPHIGGVLYRYRAGGNALAAERVSDGVSSHTIGSRELDLAVWAGDTLLVPRQDRRALRRFGLNDGWRERGEVALPAPVTAAVPWREGARAGAAVLLEDGSVYAVPAA